MYQRILLTYDGSECEQKALLDCHNIAQWNNSQLFLVAVRPSPIAFVEGGFQDGLRDEAEARRCQEILEDGLRRLAAAGNEPRGDVLVGDRVHEVTEYARRINADLIIVGHQHLDGWVARWLRGSWSTALIEHAPCSVLVVITH